MTALLRTPAEAAELEQASTDDDRALLLVAVVDLLDDMTTTAADTLAELALPNADTKARWAVLDGITVHIERAAQIANAFDAGELGQLLGEDARHYRDWTGIRRDEHEAERNQAVALAQAAVRCDRRTKP